MYLIFKVGVVLERSRESQHLSAQSHKMSRRISSPIDVNQTDGGPTTSRTHHVLRQRSAELEINGEMSRFVDFHLLSSTTFQHHAGLAIFMHDLL